MKKIAKKQGFLDFPLPARPAGLPGDAPRGTTRDPRESKSMMDTGATPQNPDAEKAVIGALLMDSDRIPEVSAIFKPDDFYSGVHRDVYQAILKLSTNGGHVDLVTLGEALKDKVSVADLEDFNRYGFSPVIMQHARIVKETSQKRALRHMALEIVDAVQGSQDSNSIAAHFANRLVALQESRGSHGFRHVGDFLIETQRLIDKARERGDGLIGVPTGYGVIDAMTGGIESGDLWFLGGRPSAGKTALALNILKNVVDAGYLAAFVSLEMQPELLVMRLLSSELTIENRCLRMGRLNSEEIEGVVTEIGRMDKLPLWFATDDNWDRLKAQIRALKMRQPSLSLVFVDYVQILDPEGPDRMRYQELSRIARDAKRLAQELSIGVVCLSQLSRRAEEKPGERPRLLHLKESGGLEENADIVGLLWGREEEESVVELNFEKVRNGEEGQVYFAFDKRTVTFRALPGWQPPENTRRRA